MTGYTLKATVAQYLADSVVYKLSRIAYEKKLTVRSELKSKALSERLFTIKVSGDPAIVQDALAETKAYLRGASDVVAKAPALKDSLDVELTVM